MSNAICSYFVHLCSSLREWPAAALCTSLAVAQMAILDYYLVHYLGKFHLTWIAFDAIILAFLIISIRQASTAITKFRKGNKEAIAGGSIGWLAWFFMSISVAGKAVVTFRYFAHHLAVASSSFFGTNTLKTTIAMGSGTFLLLLITQHDMPTGSKGRLFIQELAGTVVFDILDTVDILEVLFDLEAREDLHKGLEEFILAVAVMNLVMPTVPLFLLAKSKFGHKKLSMKFVHGHRILMVLAVNLPNLMIRSMLWHGLDTGISPFTLKNILGIFTTMYEIYEHNKEALKRKGIRFDAGSRYPPQVVSVQDPDSRGARHGSRLPTCCGAGPPVPDQGEFYGSESDKAGPIEGPGNIPISGNKSLKSELHAAQAPGVSDGSPSNSDKKRASFDDSLNDEDQSKKAFSAAHTWRSYRQPGAGTAHTEPKS